MRTNRGSQSNLSHVTSLLRLLLRRTHRSETDQRVQVESKVRSPEHSTLKHFFRLVSWPLTRRYNRSEQIEHMDWYKGPPWVLRPTRPRNVPGSPSRRSGPLSHTEKERDVRLTHHYRGHVRWTTDRNCGTSSPPLWPWLRTLVGTTPWRHSVRVSCSGTPNRRATEDGTWFHWGEHSTSS